VLRPERRDGQPAGTRAPRRELYLGREAQLGHQAVTADGPPEADQGTAADPGLRHGGQAAGGHGHEFQLHRLRAVGRVVAEAQLDRQKAAVGAEGRVGHRTRRGQPDRFRPAGGQVEHLQATARDTPRHPGDPGCAGRDHSREAATRPRRGWIPQLVGRRSRTPGHGCQQQAAAGPPLDQVTGRQGDLRPGRPARPADFPRHARGGARIGTRRVAGQPQRAGGARYDRVRPPHPGHRLPVIGEEIDGTQRSGAAGAGGPDVGTGLHRPAARRADELVASLLPRQATDRRRPAGGRVEPHRPLSGGRQPQTAGPGRGRTRDPVGFRRHPLVTGKPLRHRHRHRHRSRGSGRPGRLRRLMP
jgi:hypothetical protein